jgi:Tol biopolymer transport system component
VEFGPEEPPFQLLLYPRTSPDGRWLAVASPTSVFVAPSGGGRATRVVNGSEPAWAPDGSAIIYCSGEAGAGESLWRIPFNLRSGTAAGPPEPLTVGRGRDTQATVARDGKHIVFAAQDVTSELQEIPFDAEAGVMGGDPRTVASGREKITFSCPSPRGNSFTYAATRGDGTHIWLVVAGSRPVQLTSDPAYEDGNPRWSPDGAQIAFTRAQAGGRHSPELWLVGADGANPRKLVAEAGRAIWMPDGRSLLFWRNGALARVDVHSREVTKVDLGAPSMPVFNVSPDGAWVAFQTNAKDNVEILAAPLAGGAIREVAATPKQNYHPSVSPSGRWLYYQLDHKNLYRVPGPGQGWRPATPEKVTHFPESNLYLEDPQVSSDGHWLAFSRIRVASTLWVLTLGD